jgi:hypothetical protein
MAPGLPPYFVQRPAEFDTLKNLLLNPARTEARHGIKTLRVWNLENGNLIATFHCDAPAICCAFADGRRVVAGDEGGRVYFLYLEEPPQT